MEVSSLSPGLGNWVDGQRFFNRDREIELFMKYLLDGQSMSIVAQRRIGKTSLMREASRRLEGRVISLHVDLEKSQTPEDAIVELSLAARSQDRMWRKITSVFGEAFNAAFSRIENVKLSQVSINLRANVASEDWRQKGDEIFAILASVAEQNSTPVAVFFDEVPILVNRLLKGGDGLITPDRKITTDIFMSWLRDNVIRHTGKISIVVTGSIGLEPLLNQAGLNGTLNAYRAFRLDYWQENTAVKCLLALAKNQKIDLPQDVAKHMIKKLGCAIPHHVQMFFDHVYSTHYINEIEGAVTTNLVDEVYDETMTGLRGHPELSHMEERLRTVLNAEDFRDALLLLTQASVVGYLDPAAGLRICAEKRADKDDALRIFNDIIAILVHDGYLTNKQDRLEFDSNLLKDWWSRRFGQGYRPI